MHRSLLRNIIVTLALSTAAVSDTAAVIDPELAAIRATAEAYLSASPEKLRSVFLPSMSLFTTDDKESLRVIPFAEYLQRVSGNTASKEDVHTSIESIDRAGSAAIVKIVTTRANVTVTDYLSLLRIEKRWKIVNKTFAVQPRAASDVSTAQANQQQAVSVACSPADHREFDFMLGSWRTSDPGNATVAASEGESTIEATLNGCVIHEHRRLFRDGKRLFDGDAYWGYDLTTKHWLLFYMDDQSHMQVYEGRAEAEKLAFYRERPDPDGKLILIRIIYSPVSGSGYIQAVSRSADHGATWQSAGTTSYQAKH
jgi:hypothetical protein